MPSELNRFSWGAFLLPLFWGVAYGSWPVLGAWALALAVPLLLAAMFGTPAPNTSVATIIGVTVVSELVAGVVRLWVGANANRTLWMRESFRLSVLPDAKTRFTVERFLGKQAKWTIWGAILVGAGFLVLIPTTAQTWSKYELTYVGAAVPLVWLAAEVFLGVWLDSRMRMEPPDNEQAAGDMI
jgi:putative Ca2+/H+ antiporter (TMEM165/GDT1 family)